MTNFKNISTASDTSQQSIGIRSQRRRQARGAFSIGNVVILGNVVVVVVVVFFQLFGQLKPIAFGLGVRVIGIGAIIKDDRIVKHHRRRHTYTRLSSMQRTTHKHTRHYNILCRAISGIFHFLYGSALIVIEKFNFFKTKHTHTHKINNKLTCLTVIKTSPVIVFRFF